MLRSLEHAREFRYKEGLVQRLVVQFLCIQVHFGLHEIFFERKVGIKSIGDLRFSDCRIHVWKGVLCGFLSSSVLVSSVQLPTSMSNTGGIWDNEEKRYFYKITCTCGSDTAC